MEEYEYTSNGGIEGDLASILGEPIEFKLDEVEFNQEILPPQAILDLRENPPFLVEMLQRIDDMEEYAQNRGTMGLDFGIQSLNKAFNGLNPGLTLVAGPSNTGKSMLLLEIMRRVIANNQYQNEDHPKKAYCIYFSLDDSRNELLPRMMASDQRITINQALFPKTLVDKPVILEKRQQGLLNLKKNAPFFTMYDATDCQHIQDIEAVLRRHHTELETLFPGEYQIVAFIDNFHDVTYKMEGNGFMEENQKYDYTSGRLGELAVELDLPILCSAELKKSNVMKRNTLEDVKSSGKIVYEAKGIILLFNEVGVKNDSADIYWEMASAGDSPYGDAKRKMPILEMHVAKNKFSEFKGRCFLKFIPEMASFMEPSDEEEQLIREMVRG